MTAMAEYRAFDYQLRDGVGTVTFTRPDTLNSLTFEVYAELEHLASACQTDEAVRVLVLTGTGRGFCSGGDVQEIIGELAKRDVKGMLEFTRRTRTASSVWQAEARCTSTPYTTKVTN